MDNVVDSSLVQISKSRRSNTPEGKGVASEGGMSRRSFLKVLGAGSATAGLTACARDVPETIYPFNKGEPEQIPGIAQWYSSTCTECSAGCGIQVRTREGRAVKVEGSPLSPINQGGLCALGQASLQSLYDPDRVRQPLKRVGSGDSARFEPVSWDEAIAKISEAIADDKLDRAFITDELGGGALAELVAAWSNDLKVEHVSFDPLQPTAFAKASKLVYGVDGLPQLKFENADFILNFGADFLETWISPCEYARGWSKAKKQEKPVRIIHIEPRASLTAANADEWLASVPGSESTVALALLKAVLDHGKTTNLNPSEFGKLRELAKDFTIERAAKESGIAVEKLSKIVDALVAAKSPLVLAGGTLGLSDRALPLAVVAQLLNLALGAVGKTVDLSKTRKITSSAEKLAALSKKMSDKKVGVLFVHKANPAYSFPSDFNFDYAIRYVPMVVSFTSHLDETSQHANYVLPANTGLEGWGDVSPTQGVYSLIQPSMTSVFDTQDLGTMLLSLAKKAGKKVNIDGADSGQFLDVLKGRWKKLHSKFGAGKSFEDFWNESLERGGLFNNDTSGAKLAEAISDEVLKLSYAGKAFADKGAEDSEIVLFPFSSVKTFDGRAANKPWLQELPDPVSQIFWDGWAEVHPDTAKKYSLESKDMLTVRNYYGEVNLPVYVTPYIKPGIVAVPLGHGHSAYGRFATINKESGNVFNLLPSMVSDDGGSVALLSSRVQVIRGRGRWTSMQQMGSDSQQGRELARTTFLTLTGAKAAESKVAEAHVESGKAAGENALVSESEHEHAPKQMYVQREHPVYQWGMSIDLSACTGCSACVVACYAENNIPVVGKEAVERGREMSWLRMERYHDGSADELQVSFLPMVCQHCQNAPCEPVCPVFATYHNEDGLNAMVYNRCVGTRYCSNNCSYKVRRFNWHEFDWPEPMNLQLNPDVTRRTMGVMEKCTFCVQRINEAKDNAKDLGRTVLDGEVKPACVQSCPTQALVFGNLKDPESKVSKAARGERAYKVLDKDINTQPSVTYLERVRYER